MGIQFIYDRVVNRLVGSGVEGPIHGGPNLFGSGKCLALVDDVLMNRGSVGTRPGGKVPDLFVVMRDFPYAGFPVLAAHFSDGGLEFVMPLASLSWATVFGPVGL